MKKQKITVNINSIYKFLQVWNGIFNLTNKELEILSAFIITDKVTEDDNMCSMSNKKAVAGAVGIKDPNTLNNYIKKFKDKGTMLKRNGYYKLNPFLDPDTDMVEVTINK